MTTHSDNTKTPRYLLWGAHDPGADYLTRINYTTDPASDYELVAVMPGADQEALIGYLSTNGKGLLPIANFGSQPWQRADFETANLSADGFIQASTALGDISLQMSTLPDYSSSPDYASLSILATAYTRNTKITASWAPQTPEMVSYTAIAGIADAYSLLEDLANNGLLTRSPFDRLHNCDQCGSSRLNVREECHKCSSSNLRDQSIVHHYTCGTQLPQEQFEDGRKLICPKCRQQLKSYGVDYDKPGVLHQCGECADICSEPAIGFVCADCSNHIPGDIVNTRQWYHYTLTTEGINAVTSGLLPHRSLESVFGGAIGAYSKRDFVNLLLFSRDIAKRYERPLSAGLITITNMQTLLSSLGASRMGQAFVLLREIIAQPLRTTDAITAIDHSIALLLPETAESQLQIIEKRLNEKIHETISADIQLQFEIFNSDTIEQLLEKISQ